ncbi:GntR family transcriptional regulator [Nocardioides sp. GCM10030258]|uniref:GntR family transcriptional regulator n=1 Tax=unclassified Nocardioides TaxID=2615069 RepID=UPI00360F1DF3
MSPEDFADITRLRLILDIQALEESMDSGGDEWEAASVASFYRLQKVEERLPANQPVVLDDEWSRLHKDFHMTLLSATSSPRLKQSCSSLFDQAERYRRFSASQRVQPRSKSGEHEAILNATINREREKAVDLLNRHISRTQHDISAIIPKLGP